jgi:hypothetical protein
MGGQFPPDWGWSVCSGLQLKSYWFKGGQFHPDLGGQFDRILHLYCQLSPITVQHLKVNFSLLAGVWYLADHHRTRIALGFGLYNS